MTTIRVAEPEDAEAICGVHVEAISAVDTPAYDIEQLISWASYPVIEHYPIDEEGSLVLVAEDDEEVVGFAELDLDEAAVEKLYVSPDRADEGIGMALLDRVEAAAADRGLDGLSVVATLNAVSFYEEAGYRRVGETTRVMTADVEFPCVVMETDLG